MNIVWRRRNVFEKWVFIAYRGKQTSVSWKEIFKRMHEWVAKTNDLILSPVAKVLDLNTLECALTRVIKSMT